DANNQTRGGTTSGFAMVKAIPLDCSGAQPLATRYGEREPLSPYRSAVSSHSSTGVKPAPESKTALAATSPALLHARHETALAAGEPAGATAATAGTDPRDVTT